MTSSQRTMGSYLLVLSMLVGTAWSNALADETGDKPQQAGAVSYVVVASEATFADHDWKSVVEALTKKHKAQLLTYSTSVGEVLGELADIFPRYTCFVARPQEAGRDFVQEAHILTRKLDSDPYGDIIWGIVTGYDADDALRIARHKEPLSARRVL
ncbi:MAG: hypothetical protein H8E73_09595, partial [Planctomycetes bacterium]|nr:hypothetical protein [Planctomycetota bacterium]